MSSPTRQGDEVEPQPSDGSSEKWLGSAGGKSDSKCRTGVDAMLLWLRSNGGEFDDLKVINGDAGSGRIVVARNTLHDGQRILSVPLKCLITKSIAKTSLLANMIKKTRCKIRSDHTWFAVFLMEHKRMGQKSKFAKYIDALPQAFDYMPLNFTPKSGYLQQLRGSIAIDRIKAMRKDLNVEYQQLCNHVSEIFEMYTFDDFVWARLCVLTRLFNFEIRGKETDGLVPFADMLNHANKPQVSWHYDDKSSCFVMTAETQVSALSQLFDSYGRKSQSRFFVNYGFTVDRNHRDNEACIRVELQDSDPDSRAKIPLLGRGGGSKDKVKKFIISCSFSDKGG